MTPKDHVIKNHAKRRAGGASECAVKGLHLGASLVTRKQHVARRANQRPANAASLRGTQSGPPYQPQPSSPHQQIIKLEVTKDDPPVWARDIDKQGMLELKGAAVIELDMQIAAEPRSRNRSAATSRNVADVKAL